MDQIGDIYMNICRICSTDVDVLYPLFENDTLTNIGEKFKTCLHLRVLAHSGYPDKICTYCQTQLNMCFAFIVKATKSHEAYIDALEQMQEEEGDILIIKSEKDPEQAEVSDDEDEVDCHEYSLRNDDDELTYEELIQANDEDDIDDTVQDNYNEEYLDTEYIDEFETELASKSNSTMKSKENVVAKPATKRKASKSPRLGSSKRRYPHECVECNQGFVQKSMYDAHVRSKHKGLPAFSCPHCPRTFNGKPKFDYHMQDHNNHRPAKCTMCDKSFKNKQDLNSHLRVHNDIRKYMCDVCGKRFRSQSHMAYHRYSHFEERNFHCNECPQTFKSPHILRTHKNTVHSDICRYECAECGKKFKRDHHLVAHKRTHDVDRPKKARRSRKKVEDTQILEENAEIIEDFDVECAENIAGEDLTESDGVIFIIPE